MLVWKLKALVTLTLRFASYVIRNLNFEFCWIRPKFYRTVKVAEKARSCYQFFLLVQFSFINSAFENFFVLVKNFFLLYFWPYHRLFSVVILRLKFLTYQEKSNLFYLIFRKNVFPVLDLSIVTVIFIFKLPKVLSAIILKILRNNVIFS